MEHIITFEDDTVFKGDILKETWNQLSDKKIKKWELKLIDEKSIILENYEAYNCLVEKSFNILGGQTLIRDIYLIGRREGLSYITKFNMIDNSIIEYKTEFDKEYCAVMDEFNAYGLWRNGRPCTGWKKGIVLN